MVDLSTIISSIWLRCSETLTCTKYDSIVNDTDERARNARHSTHTTLSPSNNKRCTLWVNVPGRLTPSKGALARRKIGRIARANASEGTCRAMFRVFSATRSEPTATTSPWNDSPTTPYNYFFIRTRIIPVLTFFENTIGFSDTEIS